MVCLYCSQPTKVTNSRAHGKKYLIWRRRACIACGAVFTTEEQPVLESAFVVEYANTLYAPFSRDVLFASVYESCRHREHAADDAAELTKTIVSQLLQNPNKKPGALAVTDIIRTTRRVLGAFDTAAATYYTAYYAKAS